MAKNNWKELSPAHQADLLGTLLARFEKNKQRHKGLVWDHIKAKLDANKEKLWSLHEMERTGGEPDVTGYDKNSDEFIFYDCSAESPKGRRSLCYDQDALESRKENKPQHSAVGMATEMGITLLTESEYRDLQQLEKMDTKTSNWIITPDDIRKLGGALFGDHRYGKIFIYHNGAESYYAARGFRGALRV